MTKKYTIREVAQLFNVSHDAVTKWVKSGKLKGKKEGLLIGRTSPFLIPESEVERLKKAKEKKEGK